MESKDWFEIFNGTALWDGIIMESRIIYYIIMKDKNIKNFNIIEIWNIQKVVLCKVKIESYIM
jgi:hypothetical protein